jgi:hypothetical protein
MDGDAHDADHLVDRDSAVTIPVDRSASVDDRRTERNVDGDDHLVDRHRAVIVAIARTPCCDCRGYAWSGDRPHPGES